MVRIANNELDWSYESLSHNHLRFIYNFLLTYNITEDFKLGKSKINLSEMFEIQNEMFKVYVGYYIQEMLFFWIK